MYFRCDISIVFDSVALTCKSAFELMPARRNPLSDHSSTLSASKRQTIECSVLPS